MSAEKLRLPWRLGAARLHRDRLRPAHLMLVPPLLLLALYGVIYVHHVYRLVSFPFGWDQGEAYDAWSAWLVVQGQLPYSHNDTYPYFSINYPPLWAALVSIPMAVFGPSLAPARAFSAVVALVAAVLIAAAAWRRTRTSTPLASALLAAFVAGGLFLASPYVFHTTPLSRLNSTLVLLGVLAITCFEQPSRRRIVLGTLILVAAAYTKPTSLFIAAACFAWVIAVRPRLGWLAAAAYAGAGAAILGVLTVLTDGAFWLNVVTGNAGPYDFGQLGRYFVNFVLIHILVLTFAAIAAYRAARQGKWSPWLLAFPLSLVEALLVGESGAGESYFLSAIAVSSVLAGTAVARILAPRSEPAPPEDRGGPGQHPATGLHRPAIRLLGSTPALLGALLLVQTLIMAHGPLSRRVPLLPDRGMQGWSLGLVPTQQDREAGEEIVALMRASAEPILSEEPSFPLAAGKAIVGNTTHLHTLDEMGLWNSTMLVADIRARRYGLIALNAHRYPPAVLSAIGSSYYIVRTIRMGAATYHIFLPGAG